MSETTIWRWTRLTIQMMTTMTDTEVTLVNDCDNDDDDDRQWHPIGRHSIASEDVDNDDDMDDDDNDDDDRHRGDTRYEDYGDGFLRPQIVFTMVIMIGDEPGDHCHHHYHHNVHDYHCHDKFMSNKIMIMLWSTLMRFLLFLLVTIVAALLVTMMLATMSILIRLTSIVTNIGTGFLQNWLRLESSQIS